MRSILAAAARTFGNCSATAYPRLPSRPRGAHYFDWHHTEADTLDKVNPDDFRKNLAAMAVMSYVLADMPGRLVYQPAAPNSHKRAS